MSRTASCYDIAPMESFFHILKVELVHQRRWATRADARRTHDLRMRTLLREVGMQDRLDHGSHAYTLTPDLVAPRDLPAQAHRILTGFPHLGHELARIQASEDRRIDDARLNPRLGNEMHLRWGGDDDPTKALQAEPCPKP